MRNEHLPSMKDISLSHCLDLDEQTAVEHFLGKNKLEAEKLFQENVIYYCDDLTAMAEVGFRFYFEAFYNYIRSPESEKASEAVTSLISIIRGKYSCFNEKWISLYVLDCIDYVLSNLDKFEMGTELKVAQAKLIFYRHELTK